MIGPVSPDAVLGTHPDGSGRPTAILRGESLAQDFEHWQTILAGEEPEPHLKAARSTIAQLGGDIIPIGEAFVHRPRNEAPSIHYPVELAAYSPASQILFDTLNELHSHTKPGEETKWRGEVLPIGRVILRSGFRELSGDEIEQRIRDGFMGFDETLVSDPEAPKNYVINGAGRLLVQMASKEFWVDEDELFETTETTVSTLHEGRFRLERLASDRVCMINESLPDFVLSGIRISPGSLSLGLEPKVYVENETEIKLGSTFQQIYGGQFIDAGRISGIGAHLSNFNRHRQVELIRTSKDGPTTTPHTFNNTWLGVRVYEPHRSKGPRDWFRMSRDERQEIHVNGISTLRAIEAEDPANHKVLLDAVKADDVEALVLKRSGGVVVNKRRSAADNERAILRAFKQFPDGLPESLQHLEPRVRALDAAGERTNLLVADEMDLSLIPHYVKQRGVSGFLFNKSTRGDVMDINDMTSLADLVRAGIGIAKVSDGFYREFHPSGLWAKPGLAKQLLQRKEAYAFFGANRGIVGSMYQQEINWLLDQAIHRLGSSAGLSVVTGGGGGVMEAGHSAAMDKNILSIVASITSEKPEVANLAYGADAINEVISLYLLTRQAILEYMYTIAYVFPYSGHGTLLEIFNATTERKLQHKLPVPIFALNENGFYDGSKAQIDIIAEQATISRGGEIYDVSGRPDSPRKWRLVEFVDSVEEMFEAYMRFRNDPKATWRQMKITPAQIAMSLKYNQWQAARYAINIPAYLEQAGRDYANGG